MLDPRLDARYTCRPLGRLDSVFGTPCGARTSTRSILSNLTGSAVVRVVDAASVAQRSVYLPSHRALGYSAVVRAVCAEMEDRRTV